MVDGGRWSSRCLATGLRLLFRLGLRMSLLSKEVGQVVAQGILARLPSPKGQLVTLVVFLSQLRDGRAEIKIYKWVLLTGGLLHDQERRTWCTEDRFKSRHQATTLIISCSHIAMLPQVNLVGTRVYKLYDLPSNLVN